MKPADKTLSTMGRPKGTTKILLALSEKEESWFFGSKSLEDRLGNGVIVERFRPGRADQLNEQVSGFRPQVILGAWSTPRLPLAGEARPAELYVHICGSVSKQLTAAHFEAGLRVTNWGTTIAPEVAEYALLLAIAALRRLPEHLIAHQPQAGWGAQEGPPLRSLYSERVGVHGLGAIAEHLVELLRPFGCVVRAFDPYQPQELFEKLGVERVDDLDELLRGSRVLFECCALTPETEGIITRKRIEAMPPDACFINVARGRLVDESALADAVRRGRIRAGLDVFAEEPLAAGSPLRGLPSLVAMPHLGANTADGRLRAGQLAVTNVQRFMRQQPLKFEICLERFNRMT